MAYIGNNPTAVTRGRSALYTITATGGQTVFSGTDDNGNTIDLLDVEANNVFLNGSRLVDTVDFTLNGDVLTLTSGAALNDIMVITTEQEVANVASYTKVESDARYSVSFPFYKAAGTTDHIALTGTGAFPFFKADGTQDNIGAV